MRFGILVVERRRELQTDDLTIAEIDEALEHAARVIVRDDRWRAYVDRILDQRLEATP